MTFAVVSIQEERERVVGTIWAEGEAQAQVVASNLYQAEREDSIHIRPVEQRELPLRLPS